MSRKFRLYEPALAEPLLPIARLWLLRLMVPLGADRVFVRSDEFSDDALAKALGLESWLDLSFDKFEPAKVRAALRKQHLDAERQLFDAVVPEQLASNIASLGELLGLSKTDCRILECVVFIHNDTFLSDLTQLLGDMSTLRVLRVVAVLLDLPEATVREALGPKSILSSSGLVAIERSGSTHFSHKLHLLSDSFADRLFSLETDPMSLLRDTIRPCAPPHLVLGDFEHISASLKILRPYLKRVFASPKPGVNIFLYGPPGTGKSQLARALAYELGSDLFEVASEDEDGDCIDGASRLRAYRTAQCFLAKRSAMVLFDEVEDVFDDGSFLGPKSTAQTRKGWINHTLEENPVPTLWLSNSIRSLDPAFIRRFDMVVEVTVPPKSQREKILKDVCTDLLDAKAVTRIADLETLAPALVSRAGAVVRTVQDDIGASATSAAVELLISNTLEAQGKPALRNSADLALPALYDPRFIQSDSDLEAVADGLAHAKSGRLCLYGPPGTGKTAYGKWLAQRLKIPFTMKKASDLMSMWVGENEKNIARAFQQAEREGSLLLIDEVDSFLQDRRGSQQSWEISLVNEMLTQMESFQGIFIASTNLMAGLDQAALRRFDLKVCFGYLATQQASDLLQGYCLALAMPAPSSREHGRLALLRNLTPGDFAAVMRQHRFRPLVSTETFIAALESECAIKAGGKQAIGFIH